MDDVDGCLGEVDQPLTETVTLLGPPKYAALRLTLAQGFNGIATVVGPLIASHAFFKGENANDLGTVQYVYLAMACFATLLNIILIFIKLPEVRQAVSDEDMEKLKHGGWKGFFKKHHTIWGIFAEFMYVGAQVAVASHAIFYFKGIPGLRNPINDSLASNLFAACQATFTVGRFIAVIYLRWVDPAFSLFVHGVFLILFSILCSVLPGAGGIACLFLVFLFESHCYPVIFALASANLGPYAVIGGALTAAGVSGGAWYPSAQAALADQHGSHISYLVPMTGFIVSQQVYSLMLTSKAPLCLRPRHVDSPLQHSWQVDHLGSRPRGRRYRDCRKPSASSQHCAEHGQ